MLALLRILRNLRKREHYLRTRYHRSHPHFLLYIALDAIITLALVGGGLAVTSSNGIFERNPQTLVDLGLSTLTEAQLKTQVQQHGIDMYWVGPMGRTKYAIVVVTRDPVTVDYVSVDAAEATAVKPFVAIQTYNDPMKYYNGVRGPLRGTPDISAINSMGNKIIYNPSQLDELTVEFTDVKKVVVIKYSTPQTIDLLFQASEKLHSIL
ncbi:MAG: hypothetical protein H7227_04760 [Actinobacteria bacterium]|nr:hypothetical protein [Actinomycetota bacterium]